MGGEVLYRRWVGDGCGVALHRRCVSCGLLRIEGGWAVKSWIGGGGVIGSLA